MFTRKKFLDAPGVSYLWKRIRETFAFKNHTHTKNQISDFPTNVSAFTNDAGYLTKSNNLGNSGSFIDVTTNNYTVRPRPRHVTTLELDNGAGTYNITINSADIKNSDCFLRIFPTSSGAYEVNLSYSGIGNIFGCDKVVIKQIEDALLHVVPIDTNSLFVEDMRFIDASAFALSSHDHGSITNAGKISSLNTHQISANDSLAFVRSYNDNIERSSLQFDGSSTDMALSKKGTFETFLSSDSNCVVIRVVASSIAEYANLFGSSILDRLTYYEYNGVVCDRSKYGTFITTQLDETVTIKLSGNFHVLPQGLLDFISTGQIRLTSIYLPPCIMGMYHSDLNILNRLTYDVNMFIASCDFGFVNDESRIQTNRLRIYCGTSSLANTLSNIGVGATTYNTGGGMEIVTDVLNNFDF